MHRYITDTTNYYKQFAHCAHLQPIIQVKKYIFFIAFISGLDIYFDRFRYSVRTVITCVMAFVGLFLAVYTIWELRDSLELLPSIATLGFSLPGGCQIVYVLTHAAHLQVITNFGDLLYMCNNTLERNSPLLAVAKRSRSTALTIAALTMFGMTAFASDTFYELLWRGNLKLMLTLYIPFVDTTTWLGFWGTMTLQLVMSLIAITGHLHWTVMTTLLALQLRAMVVILEYQLKSFQRMYLMSRRLSGRPATNAEVTEAEHRRTRAALNAFLRNMLMQFNDTNRYVNVLQDTMGKVVSIQMASETIAIVTALFATVASGYRAGYGISIMLIIEILTNCYIGTQLVIEYERLEQLVYSIQWYEFEVADQRVFQLLMHKCQTMQTLVVLGQWPLSMVVGTSILKFIYNAYAMMLNCLD